MILAKTKWTILDITLIIFYFFRSSTDAHVFVYSNKTNQLIEEFNDLPAQFGPSITGNGLRVYVISRFRDQNNDFACNKQDIKPPPTIEGDYPKNAKFVALVQRGSDTGSDCTFEMKVRNAQSVNYNAVIVYNNQGDDLEQMSAQNGSGINIPAVFVGRTTGDNLKGFIGNDFVLVINDELPFNINTQLILPFLILFGLCFLSMIFYMIYRCVREEQRLRRHRLPKKMLKKLPIIKFTKNSGIHYETCVICLDEFMEGDKLRVLPCKHPYHSHCIDPWLTENRRICPVCKRKVFTKRESIMQRIRQSSSDNVTDTDDDTTPLLQNAVNSNINDRTSSNNANSSIASSTDHGTFSREINLANGTSSSDDLYLILPPDFLEYTPERINPFDRTPNLQSHLVDQLNGNNNRSIWSLPIFRLFRRTQAVSVVVPPPLMAEVAPDTITLNNDVILADSLSRIVQRISLSSNNVLSPNLSGSFKEDDDDDDDNNDMHQSIYEPITDVTLMPSTTRSNIYEDDESAFIQIPTHNGLAVCALPNAQNSVPNQDRATGRRQNNDHQFLV